ncbi:Mediator of RNA polymerase II transcription subunit 18 [Olea europaea subsp. europaea]|uniref:Mediator of RNA polymerase II transcription subunit 18 n=1 Tax=Olea europaea subsp. europaea TaxID=158383 RepID=A0A8S0PA56_OLEEU|nr:Mediator of RNA polymerase II transcription subunit 18 [Olea europaea subsp. europaea]
MSIETMQTTSLQSLQRSLPFSGNFMPKKPSPGRRERVYSPVFAMKKDASHNKGHKKGRLVDENMIVLRMRIHDLKMAEESHSPPENWMEWEKKWYVNYDSDVIEAVGLLQNLLMDSRPGLVLGVVALIILSGSTSMALLLCYLVDIFKGISF